MMRQKLLHRMKGMCGATSSMMKDELIVEKHQVDGTRLLIYIMYKLFCHTCVTSSKLYLLSFIVTMYLTKFLYEQYSNSRVLIHCIEVIILLYFLCQ